MTFLRLTTLPCLRVIAMTFLGMIAATSAAIATPELEPEPNFAGVADYYADYFHGKRTASGAVHDMTKLTAAHRTLKFGTRVRLVNKRNGKTCVVVVNDRGPFTKGRVIDVSKEAARQLGLFAGKRHIDAFIVESGEKIASK